MDNKYLFIFCIFLLKNIGTSTGARINAILANRMPPPGLSGVCGMKLDPGHCDGRQEMWYYDAQYDQCHFFLYSGCGGNGNRFPTRASCRQKCVKCPRVSCPAGCAQSRGPGGCPRCTCKKENASKICSQRPRRGDCRALFHNWTYNRKTKQCVQFVYGGCGGNANNFKTKRDCLQTCGNL